MKKKENKQEEIEYIDPFIAIKLVTSILFLVFGLSGAILCGFSLFEINNELLDLSKYVLNISMVPLSVILAGSGIFLHLTGREFLSYIIALFLVFLMLVNHFLNHF